MAMGDGGTAAYDSGFYNIGVRPAFEDLGIGGADRFGRPLSDARREPGGPRVAADGAFKTPSLRNVALTPPFFHNGGEKSLADVVRFYNRGGNRLSVAGGDTTGTGDDGRLAQAAGVAAAMGGSNLAPDIGDPSRPDGGLGLTDQEQAQLVAFLKALTDPRVACHKAPFDHPALTVSVGQQFPRRQPRRERRRRAAHAAGGGCGRLRQVRLRHAQQRRPVREQGRRGAPRAVTDRAWPGRPWPARRPAGAGRVRRTRCGFAQSEVAVGRPGWRSPRASGSPAAGRVRPPPPAACGSCRGPATRRCARAAPRRSGG
jgi:hypothetical protein